MLSLDVIDDNDYHFNYTPSLHMHLCLGDALSFTCPRYNCAAL